MENWKSGQHKLRLTLCQGQNTTFNEVDFSGIDFKVNFEGSTFDTCDLSKLNFQNITGQSIENCTFKSCILGDQNFNDINLRGSSFEDTDISNIDFQKIAFDRSINAPSLNNCKFINYESSHFEDKDFTDVSIDGAQFINCDLSKSNIHKVKERGSNFSGTVFTNCKLPLWFKLNGYYINDKGCLDK